MGYWFAHHVVGQLFACLAYCVASAARLILFGQAVNGLICMHLARRGMTSHGKLGSVKWWNGIEMPFRTLIPLRQF